MRVVAQVRHVDGLGELVEPADLAVEPRPLVERDEVVDARQPVRDQRERRHQQDQHRRAVLRVPQANSASYPQRDGGRAVLGVLVDASRHAQQTQ